VTEDFDFYRKYLNGAKEIQPRWKRCVRLVDYQLGESARPSLHPQGIREPDEASHADHGAPDRGRDGTPPARTRLDECPDEAGRLAKLHAIRNKIGYPERWRDYSAIRIERADSKANVRRAASFEFARQLGKIGQAVDHDEWGMTPPTVNAYFKPGDERHQLSGGRAPAATVRSEDGRRPNYGDTGGTIGHELTHGFDDEGRQYDAHGNLKDWWTSEDAAKFAERRKCVSDQYGGVCCRRRHQINSALTLGEDVADLGGEVWPMSRGKTRVQERNLEDRDDLSPDQRFFVGFAQWACENTRPEQQREWALTKSTLACEVPRQWRGRQHAGIRESFLLQGWGTNDEAPRKGLRYLVMRTLASPMP